MRQMRRIQAFSLDWEGSLLKPDGGTLTDRLETEASYVLAYEKVRIGVLPASDLLRPGVSGLGQEHDDTFFTEQILLVKETQECNSNWFVQITKCNDGNLGIYFKLMGLPEYRTRYTGMKLFRLIQELPPGVAA